MPPQITEIDDFQVMYSSSPFVPRIWLIAGSQYCGQLIFMPNGSVLPPDAESGGQPNLYYHEEDYANLTRSCRKIHRHFCYGTGLVAEMRMGS